MKKKNIIGLLTAILISINVTSAYAWGGKTHSYLEKQYYNGKYKDQIEDITIASEMFNSFSLYLTDSKQVERTRQMIMALETIKADKGYNFLDLNVFLEAYNLNLQKEYVLKTDYNNYKTSIQELDYIFKTKGLKYFNDTNSNVPNSLSNLKLDGYINTYVNNSNANIEAYYNYTKKVPFNILLESITTFIDETMTLDKLQRSIIANNLINEATEKLNWDLKFINKDTAPILVPPTYDAETSKTIDSYFEIAYGSPKSQNSLAGELQEDPTNNQKAATVIADEQFLKELKILTESTVQTLLNNNVLQLKTTGEIVLLDKAKYEKTILDLNRSIDMLTTNFYSYSDTTRDNFINKEDLSRTSQFYHIDLGQTAYVKEQDVTRDGIIDIFDLTAISKEMK